MLRRLLLSSAPFQSSSEEWRFIWNNNKNSEFSSYPEQRSVKWADRLVLLSRFASRRASLRTLRMVTVTLHLTLPFPLTQRSRRK
jgi:hypothetical protein